MAYFYSSDHSRPIGMSFICPPYESSSENQLMFPGGHIQNVRRAQTGFYCHAEGDDLL